MFDFGDAFLETFGTIGKGIAPRNEYHQDKVEIDPNSYQYGGKAGGADAATQRYQGLASAAGNQEGPYVVDGVPGNMLTGDRGLDEQSRAAQFAGLQSLQNTVQGNSPSVAQAQLQQGLGQSLAAQQSAAASARGGGANLAAAQRMAAQTGAAMGAQANNQAAQLRAQEIATAQGQYSTAANAARQGDLMRAGQSGQLATSQAQIQEQQRALNAQRQQGLEQLGYQVQHDQLGAQGQKEAQRNQNATDAGNINSGVERQNADMANERVKGIASAIASSSGGAGGGYPK